MSIYIIGGDNSTPAPTEYTQTFTTSDFTAGVLTVAQSTHGISSPVAYVYDTDTNSQVLGYEITSGGNLIINASVNGAFNGRLTIK